MKTWTSRTWTSKELATAMKMQAEGRTYSEIGAALHRTRNSIGGTFKKHGIKADLTLVAARREQRKRDGAIDRIKAGMNGANTNH